MNQVKSILKVSEQGVFASLDAEGCKDVVDRACRDAMPEEERTEFLRKAAELVNGTFLEEAWGEMPEEWIDIGNDVLPLPGIRDILKEGCDADAV